MSEVSLVDAGVEAFARGGAGALVVGHVVPKAIWLISWGLGGSTAQ